MAVLGAKRLSKRLEQVSKEVYEDVKDIIEETTLAIQRQAIQNAPAAGDTVATTYGSQKINTGINQFIGSSIDKGGLGGSVFIEAGASELAAYLEFGTGVSAAGYVPTLDPEFQAIAQRYYINGKGTLIKHPFLLPAWFQYQPTVGPAIKKVLENIKI